MTMDILHTWENFYPQAEIQTILHHLLSPPTQKNGTKRGTRAPQQSGNNAHNSPSHHFPFLSFPFPSFHSTHLSQKYPHHKFPRLLPPPPPPPPQPDQLPYYPVVELRHPSSPSLKHTCGPAIFCTRTPAHPRRLSRLQETNRFGEHKTVGEASSIAGDIEPRPPSPPPIRYQTTLARKKEKEEKMGHEEGKKIPSIYPKIACSS